jgi:dihydroorotate dehydrogenase
MVRPDLWHFHALDPYRWMRPFLFRLEPEQAHTLAIKLLKKGLGPKAKIKNNPTLHTSVCGLDFCNPLGLAAGFDKNAEVIAETLDFGFGFTEVGTITPQPQPGNPKPRLFRAAEHQAAINRFGFNSVGLATCLRHIKAWHDSTRTRDEKKKIRRGLLGINIGKNKDSTEATSDYVESYKAIAPYADYVTVNISSPNTAGLRDLQNRDALEYLLKDITAVRESLSAKPPLFVKIAPDLTDAQQEDIAAVILAAGVQGLIIGNTTLARGSELSPDFSREAGGLSGRPLFSLSTNVLARMHKLTKGAIPLIGCGGIASGADAYAKITAGASLVQLYTALIFSGPGLVRRIASELEMLLKREGFKCVSEAVGSKNAI